MTRAAPTMVMAAVLVARWLHLVLVLKRDPASSRKASRGSLEWQVVGLGCAYVLAVALWVRSWPASWQRPATALDGAAVAAILFAGGLRVAGQRALGTAFSWGAAAPPFLVTTGIYRRMKHPLLAGYALECLAILAVARDGIVSRMVVVGLLAVSIVAQIVREERRLRRAFAAEWEEYSRGKPV